MYLPKTPPSNNTILGCKILTLRLNVCRQRSMSAFVIVFTGSGSSGSWNDRKLIWYALSNTFHGSAMPSVNVGNRP
ncbi:hypothetical protein G6F43_013150 [Rhizopus delemar]|nr:hypothetical protein G6F43_013150 [Rhizopus delemar]